jgi:hypothetical protein
VTQLFSPSPAVIKWNDGRVTLFGWRRLGKWALEASLLLLAEF